MPQDAYSVIQPEKCTSCLVFASPHSGNCYPINFLRSTVLNEMEIRSSEDAFVDRLFDAAPTFGAPLLMASVPRAFVDFNRSAEELDPSVIEDVHFSGHNPRISSGLGVIPRVVANGRAIYQGKISFQEADRRISKYWKPYHIKLQELLGLAQKTHGQAILIDCHSMPHEVMDGRARVGMKRPDVVLGDRFGASSGHMIMEKVETAFESAGFNVARNSPFAGAYTTQVYGRPTHNQHSIQVEIDRSLYMNERLICPNDGFEETRRRLHNVIEEIVSIGQVLTPVAAE